MTPFTTKSLENALTAKLMLNFGKTPEEATDQEMMKASALVLRDVMAIRGVTANKQTRREQKKQVHYLSLEFLMGRSLMKNAYNLGVVEALTEAIGELVMARLKDLDEVAYVRFASVYREFKDIDTFLAELNGLKERLSKG